MIRKRGSREETTVNVTDGTWQGAKVRFRSNRIIVKLKAAEGDSVQALESSMASIQAMVPGSRMLRAPSRTGRFVLILGEAENIPELALQLSRRDDIEYAEPDVIDTIQVIPSDTRYDEQWGYPKINSHTAWDLQTGDPARVLIGIIDSGISMSVGGALNHPDLNAPGRFIMGTDFVDGGTPRDLNAHGTHVAGIAAAESNNATGVAGMNWGCNVYVCRTLDANGSGTSSNFADAMEEITDYAVAQNLKVVINYSGGGGDNQTKRDACQYASDHGMLLCAAVGNDNGGPVIFPAAYSTTITGVVGVGSTTDSDAVSGFSNHGPEVTVVAPGSGILSTTPTYSVDPSISLNYDVFDGTSMATPFVTGLAALMWSRHPAFSNTKIKDCLKSSAKKLGAGSFNNAWGHGRIDAEKALRCGDFVFTFFTSLTRFTRFTPFTLFTRFTSLTRFTSITRFTPFTALTRFTTLTRFTPFTSITRFTRLTPFTAFTRFPPVSRFDPGDPRLGGLVPEVGPVRSFVRFGGTVFDPAELQVERFGALAAAMPELARAGLTRIDEVATTAPEALAKALGWELDLAGSAVAIAQALMREVAMGSATEDEDGGEMGEVVLGFIETEEDGESDAER
ncbi:S8 family serine peptidase [Humitalea sp. 24SJ18S-53]|uniref:S8 family serine peptidase n=1 Tax=Humitalea sp. 24SJ18S-53 TaxID=3422307 RepID=UPI003D67B937